jgi:hypothetical protein
MERETGFEPVLRPGLTALARPPANSTSRFIAANQVVGGSS